MRVLAVDYGEKRVGLAIGDTETSLALPHGVLERQADESLAQQLRQVVLEEDVATVVIGDPVSTDARTSQQTGSARAFAELLRHELNVPVEMFDERFTSQRADVVTVPGARTRSRDELAAMFLLQDYLERYKTGR